MRLRVWLAIICLGLVASIVATGWAICTPHASVLTLSAAFLGVAFFNWLLFRTISKVGKTRHTVPETVLAVAIAGFVTTAVWFGFFND
jgi:hypothetical protein